MFDDYGISTEGQGYAGKHSWAIVKKIERANGLILIFLDTSYAYVISEAKLKDPDAFYEHINELYKNI